MKSFIILYLLPLLDSINQRVMILPKTPFLILIAVKIFILIIYLFDFVDKLFFILVDVVWVSCLLSRYTWNTNSIIKHLSQNGFGLGTYAANMYFAGYLNKILPENEVKNLSEIAERIKDFVDKEKISMPIRKLFILLPKSGRIEPEIAKHSEKGLIRARKNLNDLGFNRAGVKGRLYTNTVYKVYLDETKKNHCSIVAEYASPLPTIMDATKDLSKESRRIIIDSFYSRIEELLDEHPECNNYCVLIKFDDDEPDSVVHAIQDRLKELLAKSDPSLLHPKSDMVHGGEQTGDDCERSLENDVESSTSFGLTRRKKQEDHWDSQDFVESTQ